MKTRADFPPGTKVISTTDGKWGIVVSEKRAAESDKSCGWDRDEERRLSRVWVEWFSISISKEMGPVLHTAAENLKRAGVDVRYALK